MNMVPSTVYSVHYSIQYKALLIALLFDTVLLYLEVFLREMTNTLANHMFDAWVVP